MAPTSAELFSSPDQYLHSFERDDAVLVTMDRAAYARSLFLDHRISPAAPGALRMPVAAFPPPPARLQPTRWIFHVAHCGSTLLARALEVLSGDLVLREPMALRQVALEPDPVRLRLTLAMLARRYDPVAAPLVKANVPVNFILDQIAASDPGASAILLYCGLEDYLKAILRSDQHRAWVRAITAQLAAHLGDAPHTTDAERAAALWVAQMARFAATLETLPGARTLDAEVFFATPGPVLASVAGHFEMEIEPAAIGEVGAGPRFSSDAKRPGGAGDTAARRARKRALEPVLADEIAAAKRWIERAAPRADAILTRIRDSALSPLDLTSRHA
jgi:hypothetical protein